MESRRIALSLVTPCLFLASVGLARAVLAPTTWVVAAGGGGNFTDIQPAIDAASDGDLILIQAGSYSDFTLDKGLTLIGEPGVVADDAFVQAVTAPASLAEMRLDLLSIGSCDYTVVVDGVHVDGGLGIKTPLEGDASAAVLDCTDVRFVDALIEGNSPFFGDHGLYVSNSRVEVSSSTIRGEDSPDQDCLVGYAGDGGAGLIEDGASRVHATLSDVRAGNGGNIIPVGFCVGGQAGSGGHGALVLGGELIVAGGKYAGGDGGATSGLGYCGGGGSGVRGFTGQSTLRRSGATFLRGEGGGPCSNGKALAIQNATATPGDPTLERLSDPVVAPGATVTLRVTANPGSFTRLFLGTAAQVSPTPNTFLELLLVKQTSVGLGFIPASGFVDYQLSLDPSAGYPPGTTLYAQAVANYPGEHRRTNSLPLVLR